MNSELFFESASDERGTPQAFFDELNAEFHFDIDVAANKENTKCETYFGSGGIAEDALEQDWAGLTCFNNPPYSVAGAFVKKAREEADKGAMVVNLLPVRSDTKYWHKYIWDKATRLWYPGTEVRFIPGRLTFELHVSNKMRELVNDKHHKGLAMGDRYDEKELIKNLVEITGLPKMAIQGIWEGKPDDELLSGAPFPSCIVVFRGVES